MKKASFGSDFKRSFAKGLVVLLPTALTLFILMKIYELLLDSIGNPVTHATEWVVTTVGLEPFFVGLGASNGDGALQIPRLFGFLAGILIVYFVGSFFASFLGRKILPSGERLLLQIPIFKVVYPYAKQVTDFFLEEKKSEYQLVVAVPYPRKGLYSIGFVTGDGMRTVSEVAGTKLVNVFIPSSPTPVTGYTIFVDPAELVQLNISVDQALRFTISGGVIIPPVQVQTVEKPLGGRVSPPPVPPQEKPAE